MIFLSPIKKLSKTQSKKQIKNSLFLSILISTMLIFSSCENIFSGRENSPAGNSGDKTYLTISLGKLKNTRTRASASGRTVYPLGISVSQLKNFTLTGAFENGEEQELFTAEDSSGFANNSLEILPGNWAFTLTASFFDSATSNDIVYSDSVNYEIRSGVKNLISFELKPQLSGNGGFKITVNLPGDNKLDKVRATLTSLSGSVIETKDLEITSPTNPDDPITATYSKANISDENGGLEPGSYHLLFEFLAAKVANPSASADDWILVNQWESYVCIIAQKISTANLNLDFNTLYTISYNNADGSPITDFYEGVAITKYSPGSTFPLPRPKINGKVFLGWKRQGTDEDISEIKATDREDFTLVAQTAEPVLYISEDGDDSINSNDKGFTSTNSFKTIEGACKQLRRFGESDFDWTIYINGEVTGIPTGSGNSSTYGPIIISDEENEEYGITPDHAKSITITGMNGRGADGSILAGTEDTSHNIIEPVDILNRGSTGSSRTSPVLSINTTVPVTITNLKITGGNGENGGGIFIKKGATVSLGDGVLITQNRSIRGGAIFNQGTLFIYGTAILGKIDATDYASDDSSQNDTNSIYGGGIYNGDTAATVAKTTIIAKLYLGYKLSDDGVIPVKEELKGGIYYCWANSGGGIYNAIKSLVYLDSGTIQYNGVKNYGGGLYNNDASRLEMTGGKIIKNSASQTSSVMNGGGVCNDWLNSVFIMSGGLINENRAWCTGTGTSNGQGGGVFNGGKMFMYGTAVIGNKDASASATEASCGNKANIGGGIYNDYATDRRGYLYIGYEPDTDGITPKEADFSGGIYNNYSKDNSNGNNKDGGGAIYSTAFPPNYGDVRIAKGTIAYNSTEDYGGAYCGKEITITGGSILNNSAGKKGGAIYLKDNTTSTLSIGGSVQIPYTGTEETGYQNDICPSVYSKTYFTKIKILSALTNHSASNQLRITPENYHEGIQLITIDSAAETDYATELPKFVITPEIHAEYNTRADWEFNDSGKLHSRIPFAEITVAFSDPDINVSATYNNGYKAGAGVIQGTRNVVFTADPGYTYTWMLDDDIITNTVASDDAVAILSDKNDGTNNVLTINTLKLIHGGIYDVYLEATKAGIKYSYMAQMKIQNY